MRLLILLFLAFLFGCENYKIPASNSKSLTLEDSIRNELNFSDSIEVLKTYYADSTHLYVFIDNNLNSKFHDELKKMRFSNYIDFDSTLKQKENLATKSLIPKNLQKRWVPIYSYRGKFYFFVDCEFQTFFEINDTAIMGHTMEDEYFIPIKDYQKKDALEFLRLYDENRIDFIAVDTAKSIYKIKFYNECSYFTSIENLNKFPIIVQHCHEEESNLIEFEKPECN